MLARLRSSVALAALGAALVLSRPTTAQCFGPDGLTGPCWEPTFATLPQFPDVQLPSIGICWDNCAPTTLDGVVGLTQPQLTACAKYSSTLTVTDAASGTTTLSGLVTLDYTRTWEERSPDGTQHVQAWRFLAKIRFSEGFGPCPVPTCLFVPGGSAFFYGYVDWVQDCDTGEWSNTLMLFHNCDTFAHGQISAAPGFFHPSTMYAVVAPHSAANPFVPSLVFPAPAGPLVAEAVRNATNPLSPTLCTFEEPIEDGTLVPLAYGCICGGAPVFQQSANLLTGSAACSSSFGSLFIPSAFPLVPWVHMVSTSIGRWSSPSVYPGNEGVFADEGLFRYLDSCTDKLLIEVDYGATTVDGWEVVASPLDPPLTRNFVDLASNYSQGVNDPVQLPVVGLVRPTEHLIYANVP